MILPPEYTRNFNEFIFHSNKLADFHVLTMSQIIRHRFRTQQRNHESTSYDIIYQPNLIISTLSLNADATVIPNHFLCPIQKVKFMPSCMIPAIFMTNEAENANTRAVSVVIHLYLITTDLGSIIYAFPFYSYFQKRPILFFPLYNVQLLTSFHFSCGGWL